MGRTSNSTRSRTRLAKGPHLGKGSRPGVEGDGSKSVVHPGEAFITQGRLAATIPDLDDEGARATLHAADSEPLDEIGARLRLIDVLVESFVVVGPSAPA